MRIQSIPAVYAFKNGRPVDGFVGALPESQIKQFVQRLSAGAGPKGPSPVEEAVEMAKEAIANGDHGRAATIFTQVLEHEPDNADAIAGLARAYIARNDLDRAKATLDRTPKEAAGHAEVAAARAAPELAQAPTNANAPLAHPKPTVH